MNNFSIDSKQLCLFNPLIIIFSLLTINNKFLSLSLKNVEKAFRPMLEFINYPSSFNILSAKIVAEDEYWSEDFLCYLTAFEFMYQSCCSQFGQFNVIIFQVKLHLIFQSCSWGFQKVFFSLKFLLELRTWREYFRPTLPTSSSP